MAISPDLTARAHQYVDSQQIAVEGILGYGKDGAVWRTSRPSALKIHVTNESYLIERDAYIRLSQLNVVEIAGFSIPMLFRHDDDLMAIEISIVKPPFLVDFASAIFDEPPDFIEDEGNTFADFMRFRFDEHANAVLALYYELASSTGIYLPDMHSENVKFADGGAGSSAGEAS